MSDRREFIFRCEHMGGTTWTVEHQWAIEGEAEEVVRCRDCVSFNHRDELGTWCCLHGTGFHRRPTGEDDYCSKGKRRDTNRGQ